MTTTRRRSSKLVWLALLFFSGMASSSHALVITPARTEVHLAGGTRTQVSLTATNDDKVEIQVDLSKKDWFIPAANKTWTVDRWLNLAGPPSFYLKPGESHQVDVTLQCPKDMQGEVVGMISFLYKTEHPGMVTPMISVSMYLMAAGTEKASGDIADMIVRKLNDQITISARVRSTGNVHLRPSGRLVVADAQGKEVAAVPVVEGQPTYPGRENIYFGSFPANIKLPSGSYTAQADLTDHALKLQSIRNFKVMPDGQIQMDPVTQEAKSGNS